VKSGNLAKNCAGISFLCYRRKFENIEACTVKSYGTLRVMNGLIISMYCVTKYTVYNLVVHNIHSLYTNDDLYLPMFELRTYCEDCFLLLYMGGRQ
jgi:hypothetical protein